MEVKVKKSVFELGILVQPGKPGGSDKIRVARRFTCTGSGLCGAGCAALVQAEVVVDGCVSG